MLKCLVLFLLPLLWGCEKATSPTGVDTGMSVARSGLNFRYEGGPRTYLNQNRDGDGILSLYNGTGGLNGLYAPNGLGLYDNLVLKVSLNTDGTLALPAGGGVFINNKQVIGPQRPAISDALTPEQAVVRLNELLAALREHGLIAGKQ